MDTYRKRRLQKKLIKLSAFFLILVLVLILHVHFNVHPVVLKVSEEEVRALTIQAVNEAALQVMAGTVDYNDILEIEKNAAGDIVMIRAKPVEINAMARNITLLSQAYITKMGVMGISVPIGTFSGISFLSGKGKELNFKIMPVGSASARFKSEFQSTGINQTRHQIYMEVDTSINVIIPGMNLSVATVTEVPVTETIIVGKVPDTYLQSSYLDEMLNLVP